MNKPMSKKKEQSAKAAPEKKHAQTPPSPNKRGYCWLTGWNFIDGWHRNSSPVKPSAKINPR
jgi:hypothetical protein